MMSEPSLGSNVDWVVRYNGRDWILVIERLGLSDEVEVYLTRDVTTKRKDGKDYTRQESKKVASIPVGELAILTNQILSNIESHEDDDE